MNSFSNLSHWKLVFILIIFSFFTLMFGNGIVSLTHPDEVFYIQTAKEMLSHHSWLTPILFDHPQFEKPILSYVLFALAIKMFGDGPFVARFWPAFFGMTGVIVVYWMSWMLFKRKRLSLLAGIILSSSFIYLALSRAVLTDMIFSTWVALSIGFFYYGYINQRYRNRGLILFWFFSAMAVLTKGLLGFVFPLATVSIYLIYKKEIKFFLCRGMLWGVLLFLLIALPWHVFMYIRYGNNFIDEYFWNVHIRRLLVAEHPKLDNWYFYLVVMFAGMLPWSIYLPFAIRRIYIIFRERKEYKDNLFFLLSWIAAVYMFTQPAHSKLASYIFPVCYSLAIIIAFYLDRALDKEINVIKSGAVVIGLGIMAMVIGGELYASNYISMIDNIRTYILLFVAITSIIIILYFRQRLAYFPLLVSNVFMSLCLLTALFLSKPYVEPWISCKPICERFKAIVGNKAGVLLVSKFYVRGVRYYTGEDVAVIDINGKGFFSPHPIPFLNTEQKLLDFLKGRKEIYAIVKEGNFEDLKRILKGRDYVIKELGGEGGKYILQICNMNI